MAKKETGSKMRNPVSDTQEVLQGAHGVQLDLSAYSVQLGGGNTMNAMDIAREALETQNDINDANKGAETFAEHFLGLAQRCKTPEEFKTLCKEIENRMHWGRAPKGIDANERRKYTGAPRNTWSRYKSLIKQGWETYKLSPNDYDSMTAFKEAHSKAKKGASARDEVTEQRTDLLQQVAALDSNFAGVLASVVKVYEGLETNTQADMVEKLINLRDEFEAHKVVGDSKTAQPAETTAPKRQQATQQHSAQA